MKKILILLIGVIVSPHILLGQTVEFYGDPKPGSLLFGFAENAKQIILDTTLIAVDKNGYFVIGFDRDDSLEHILLVKFEGLSYLKKLKLPKREYKIQKINRMKQMYVSPPKEVEERIKRERKITQTAKAKIGQVKAALFNSGFVKPISKGRVTGVFGSQRILNDVPKNPHNGIDIAVPKGTSVKAMADGIVLLSADNFYYAGNFIIVDHGLGLNSMYLHLNVSMVDEGQMVKKGEIIGKVGTTGRSTGPHLHWAVQWYNKRVDPIEVFNYPH